MENFTTRAGLVAETFNILLKGLLSFSITDVEAGEKEYVFSFSETVFLILLNLKKPSPWVSVPPK
jgi:hypothetical protein